MYTLLLALLAFIGFFRYVVYPTFLSPLAKIPNAHWLAPITPLWIHWRRWNGAETSTVWEAIQAHGNIVRLGPKELLVNSYNGGVRTVYGGGHEKPDWYTFYENHGKRNIFTSLGRDHIMRRRRITNVYSKTFVQQSPHVREILFTLVFRRYLPYLFKTSQNNAPCGLLGLNLAYGLDTVSSFMVGIRQGTNFICNRTARDLWLQKYLQSHPSDYMFWLLEAPNFTAFLAKIGINIVPKSVAQAHHHLERWGWDVVDQAEAALSTMGGKDDQDGNFPLVYNQLRFTLSQERGHTQCGKVEAASYMEQRDELASEVLDQLVATRDVFGITLTYILWEISKHPDWQKRLQQELRTVDRPLTFSEIASRDDMMGPRDLESLPILGIVIKESMRLRTTLPVPNPRLTPYGRTTTIGPYENIPGGVRTDSYAWCLHRNPVVYPDPLQWKPERWIRDIGQREEMDNQFWAFGSGSRLCLGMALAMEMIRYVIAGIYTNFSTSIVDDSHFGTDGKFVTGLPGEDLILKLKPLAPVNAQ